MKRRLLALIRYSPFLILIPTIILDIRIKNTIRIPEGTDRLNIKW